MAKITQTISTVVALPEPPNPNVPSTFDTLAYPYTVAQRTFGVDVNDMSTELNTFATQANAVRDEVNTLKLSAETAENNAETAEAKAEQWAEGVGEVETGKYSAKHWADHAEAVAATIPEGTINDATTTLEDTWSSSKITSELGEKQDTLVSGTNIKTVNGASILGSGDVAIGANVGDIIYANTAPLSGTWLKCDGSIYLQADYTTLFAKIRHDYVNAMPYNQGAETLNSSPSAAGAGAYAVNNYGYGNNYDQLVTFEGASEVVGVNGTLKYRTSFSSDFTQTGYYVSSGSISGVIKHEGAYPFVVVTDTGAIYKTNSTNSNPSSSSSFSLITTLTNSNATYIAGMIAKGTTNTVCMNKEGNYLVLDKSGNVVSSGFVKGGVANPAFSWVIFANNTYLAYNQSTKELFESATGASWSLKGVISVINGSDIIYATRDLYNNTWYLFGQYNVSILNSDNTISPYMKLTYSSHMITVVGKTFWIQSYPLGHYEIISPFQRVDIKVANYNVEGHSHQHRFPTNQPVVELKTTSVPSGNFRLDCPLPNALKLGDSSTKFQIPNIPNAYIKAV